MTLPAVLLVLVSCLAAVQLASASLRLQDAAAGAARGIARGETVAAASDRVASLAPSARFTASERGELSCVTARMPASGPFFLITLSASSCALAGGR